MIQNDNEFTTARCALEHAERALIALKKKVYEANPERYYIFSKPYVEEIDRLRGEIDEYTGIVSAQEGSVPLWIRIKGPNIEGGAIPLTLLSGFLNEFKLGVQRIAEYSERSVIRDAGRPMQELRDLCNFRVRVASGSVRIGVIFPSQYEQTTVTGDVIRNPAKEAVRTMLSAISWADGASRMKDLERLLPDATTRVLVLHELSRIGPRKGGEISSVEFRGRMLSDRRTGVLLNERSIGRIINAFDDWISPTTVRETGVLREIDLDQNRFILRNRPDGKKELRCMFAEDAEEEAKNAIDKHVQVMGTLHYDRKGRPHHLEVSQISVSGRTKVE